jgi:hypothetical protein
MGRVTEGFVFFLLGTLVSVCLYLVSRQRKRLTLTFDRSNLYARLHPEIMITYKGTAVENLCRFRAVVWNSGTQEIRRGDIPSGGETVIKIEGGQLRSVAIPSSSPNIGGSFRERDEGSITIEFDFLNPSDYIAFDILYENIRKDDTVVRFETRIIGGMPPDQRSFTKAPPVFSWFVPVGFTVGVIVGAFYWARALPDWFQHTTSGLSIKINDLASCIISLIILLFGGLVVFATFTENRKAYRGSRLPESDGARRVFQT